LAGAKAAVRGAPPRDAVAPVKMMEPPAFIAGITSRAHSSAVRARMPQIALG
jgi:hypothetical protein